MSGRRRARLRVFLRVGLTQVNGPEDAAHFFAVHWDAAAVAPQPNARRGMAMDAVTLRGLDFHQGLCGR